MRGREVGAGAGGGGRGGDELIKNKKGRIDLRRKGWRGVGWGDQAGARGTGRGARGAIKNAPSTAARAAAKWSGSLFGRSHRRAWFDLIRAGTYGIEPLFDMCPWALRPGS